MEVAARLDYGVGSSVSPERLAFIRKSLRIKRSLGLEQRLVADESRDLD